MAKNNEKFWLEQIKLALKYRARKAHSNDWSLYRDLYSGNFTDTYAIKAKGILPVNIIFSMARKTIPNVVLGIPKVVVTGLQPGTSIKAELVERVDNILFSKLHFVRHIRRAALDAFITGIGVLKRGFDSRYGFDALEYLSGHDTTVGPKGQRLEQLASHKSGMPWVSWVSSDEYVVNWGAVIAEDVWFEAVRIWRRWIDLKEDPKFKNVDKIRGIQMPLERKVNDNGILLQPDGGEVIDKDQGWVAYWEIHDYRERKVICLVGPEHGEEGLILRESPDELATDGFRICSTFNYNDTDHFYGLSDCKIALPQQLELNDIRTQAMYARRLANMKFLVARGMIDKTEVEKLLSEIPAVVVEVQGSPREVVDQFRAAIPMDLTAAANEVRNDVREEIGFSLNQMGEFGPSRKTASEANIVQQAFQLQIDDRRGLVAEAVVELLRGINNSIFRFWHTPMVVSIDGDDGVTWWVEFRGAELEADFELQVDLTAGMPQSVQSRRQQLQELLSTFGQMVNQEEVVKYLLEQYPGLDAKRILSPGPGVGANPEQPMQLQDFVKNVQSGQIPLTPGAPPIPTGVPQ